MGLHHASPIWYACFVLGSSYDAEVCSAARTLELVGGLWSLLIVRNALFAGSTRYNDFRNRLGIATNILKTCLDGLVDAGIMERRTYSQNPELHEY
jgi:DNA-binding HxlR family transcriptional regulator